MHSHISRQWREGDTVPLHIAVAVRRRRSPESRLTTSHTHPNTLRQGASTALDLPFASITAAPARHPRWWLHGIAASYLRLRHFFQLLVSLVLLEPDERPVLKASGGGHAVGEGVGVGGGYKLVEDGVSGTYGSVE